MTRPCSIILRTIVTAFALYAQWVAAGPLELIEVPVAAKDMYSGSHALIIGLSRYTGGWASLPGVKTDVNAVEDALKAMKFDTVTMLHDPTREQIEEGIDSFIAQYGQDSDKRLLIYFAGHGETLALPDGGKQGFIVPADAPLSEVDEAKFRDKAIAMEDFVRRARAMSAKHVLFVFDSCFSGAIFSAMRGHAARPALITDLTTKPVRQFIASGSAGQQVPDVSIFRRHFVAALAGAADTNRDGYIVGTELGMYLRDRVTNETDGGQTPQFAALREQKFSEGDFVFESPISPAENAVLRTALLTQDNEPRSVTRLIGAGTARVPVERNCDDCPDMLAIPAGKALMGSAEDEAGRATDEARAEVAIERGFYMSAYEITRAQWDVCYREGGCGKWLAYVGSQDPRVPVTGVSRSDAIEYTQWLSDKTGRRYRLPTEREWEYAARAGATTARVWGDALGKAKAACRDCGSRWDSREPAPVGSFEPNAFGLYDVLGNAWEWVQDCADAPAQSQAHSGEAGDSACMKGILRGGSYATSARGVRLAARGKYPVDQASANFGFRVVRIDN